MGTPTYMAWQWGIDPLILGVRHIVRVMII